MKLNFRNIYFVIRISDLVSKRKETTVYRLEAFLALNNAVSGQKWNSSSAERCVTCCLAVL